MSDDVSVQVIILFYKEYDYFRLALKSVLAQDYSDFSILIIDDGSYDEKATEYISSLNDSRITFKQNVNNLGLAENFELARLSATGDYIVFLGQDDLLESDYLSSILPWLRHSNSVAILQPKVKVIDELGNSYLPIADLAKRLLYKLAWFLGKKVTLDGETVSILTKERAASILLLGDFLYFPTLTWKSSLMINFDTSRQVTLDYQMVMDVLSKNGELLLLSKQCARYRRHTRSASMVPERMIDRLLEEKDFHKGMQNHDLVKTSPKLRIINNLRLAQRLHGLQIFTSYLIQLDWKNSRRVLKSIR